MVADWRSRVILAQGDLTEAKVDAIVNAANNDLMLAGSDWRRRDNNRGQPPRALCDSCGEYATWRTHLGAEPARLDP
jgi:hypothetical protein